VLETLAQNLTIYMMVGVVVVVAISQVNRKLGAALGLAFWISVAVIGNQAYAMGGAIGIGGTRFSEPTFYAICAFLAAINVVAAVTSKKSRKRSGGEE
jgi:hypothetical protein